jgi:hypothetical protein
MWLPVQHQQLQFAHARGALVRHRDPDVRLGQGVAPRRAGRGQRDDRHLLVVRPLDGASHLGAAAGVEQQQHVAGCTERLQPGQQGRVVERQRRQRRPVALEAAQAQRGEQACQRAAGDEQLSATGEAPQQRLRRLVERPRQRFGGLVQQVRAFEELLLDPLFEHRHGS